MVWMLNTTDCSPTPPTTTLPSMESRHPIVLIIFEPSRVRHETGWGQEWVGRYDKAGKICQK